jgi:choline-phosphate cytidylyltransferase
VGGGVVAHPSTFTSTLRRHLDPGGSLPRTVITFGTFDVFHVGHLRILQRARELGDHLVVGVSSDALNVRKKGRAPVFSESERVELLNALEVVDVVFLEESLELKRQYVIDHGADVLVMGDDWAGRFDELKEVCEVVYLPRTPSISTTAVIEQIVTDHG